MLVINKTSVTVHHKKVRSENTVQEKRGALELDMTLTSDIRCLSNVSCTLSIVNCNQTSLFFFSIRFFFKLILVLYCIFLACMYVCSYLSVTCH